jgi:hypothetical protein
MTGDKICLCSYLDRLTLNYAYLSFYHVETYIFHFSFCWLSAIHKQKSAGENEGDDSDLWILWSRHTDHSPYRCIRTKLR